MDETIKAMIDALEEYGAGFMSIKIGKYTLIIKALFGRTVKGE